MRACSLGTSLLKIDEKWRHVLEKKNHVNPSTSQERISIPGKYIFLQNLKMFLLCLPYVWVVFMQRNSVIAAILCLIQDSHTVWQKHMYFTARPCHDVGLYQSFIGQSPCDLAGWGGHKTIHVGFVQICSTTVYETLGHEIHCDHK